MEKMNAIKMKYFFSIDYVLSLWFSRSRDKIIPGTAFLFLNKVVFIWASIFFAVTGILGIHMHIGLYVGILVLVGGIIMYGFQKKLENLIRKMNFEKEDGLKEGASKRRLLGILYFTLSFLMMFFAVSIFH